jgi:hypothetical protein
MQSDTQSDPWPFQKIERNLSLPPRAHRCVLLTTGALNPVHRGHVAMFDKAERCLESEFGLEVVGGFLSPSHDQYLLGKYGDSSKFFSAEKRIEMCIAATREHPILSVGTWESSVPDRWPDFPEVTQALVSALKARFAQEAPMVVYLCGEDHFRLARGRGLPGICVVSRAGRSGTSDRDKNIFSVEGAAGDPFSQVSATRIREALANHDMATLRADLHPDVLALLVEDP